ncbi:MAG: SEFIR domain-containing protein [Nannocystaceae bacterium]
MSDSHNRVFVVYTHESQSHIARCLGLAHRLRQDGINALIDRYVTAPPEGWPRWMLQQIEVSRYVIVVCTPTFRRHFEGESAAGVGQGTAWEGMITAQFIHENHGRNEKFIPVRFATEGDDAIPRLLRSYSRYVLPNDYELLYRHLTGQPAVVPPPLGSRRTMPSSGATTASTQALPRSLPLDHPWWRYAAMASIAGSFIFAVTSPNFPKRSVDEVLLALLVLWGFNALPSVRVLLDRRRRKVLDVFHWIWIGLWAFIIFASLEASANALGQVLLYDISMSLGIASSAAFLLRIRRN